ncbi:MAG: hypothetical protein JO352_26625 [Chloroflexi bacterium]|nr:hypothetical protein [Chloroflexota bacterium]
MIASSLVERYVNGQCEQVWAELHALGSAVRRLDHFDDGMAVARETMRRVRANCQTLILRLESLGWRFGYDWAIDLDEDDLARTPTLLGEPVPPPVLDELERRFGVMPLALRAFYEIVGEVNFVGTPLKRRGWPTPEEGLDPLYLAGAADLTPGNRGPGTGRAPITPDALGKYWLGGVGEAYIDLPDRRVDAPVLFDGGPLYLAGQRLTLVRYLRAALSGGGFLNFAPGSAWVGRPSDDLATLIRDLLPV